MDNAQSAETTVDKKKIKRDKVRSAWISFAGRIVAQIVGAIATVALGVMVLHRYTSTETRPPAAEMRYEAGAQPGQQPVNVIIITPAMLGLRDASLGAATERSCAPALDSPAASAAHLNSPAFRSR